MEKDSERITVGGKDIECKICDIDIFDLEYYHENPRVNYILSRYTIPITQDIIEKELWDQDSVKDLYQDIQKNKGLIEEIYVKGNQVIEGNSRLCAYRHLYKKATKEDQKLWATIRCKLLPDDICEEQIFLLLGTFHIKRKAQWKPFERAGYVYRMVKKLEKTVKQIADDLNESDNEIQSDVDSYKTMLDHKITDLDKFSYFKEYFKNGDLKKLRNNDPTLDNKLIGWVNNGDIPDAQQVRNLPKILNDKKAGPKFIGGLLNFEEAFLLTIKRNPEYESSFYKQLKKTRKIIKNAKIHVIKEEITKDSKKRAEIEYFVKDVGRFADNLRIIKKYKGK